MRPRLNISFAPFDGDGRRSHMPTFSLPQTQPISVSNAQARMLITKFVRDKKSTHSAQAGTLWVVVTWCHVQGKDYTIRAAPRLGYEVLLELTPNEPT